MTPPDQEKRRDERSREDLLKRVAGHMAEEDLNREIMLEMRANLKALTEMHTGITTDEHQTIMDWWREEMEIRRSRRAMFDKVKQSVAGWLAITILAGLVHLGQPIGKFLLERWHSWIGWTK